jgi:hypothetical protein
VIILQRLNDDHQVQLAHARYQRCTGIGIDGDTQRRIFARHRRERLPKSFTVGWGARFDHGLDHWIRTEQSGQHQWMRRIAQRLARFPWP